ncbi:hypothetical protein [Desulforamulus aquiferis]|uniref:Uncharacterized protein n=1 Tax=Desulforamulus aquiferis TaxID=1397668 RepID=A0AAW7Z9C6_9FIRM|nr:hypothetical protein [Desulforamulus aquiferis]MDO7786140.1 hypothetical protein [Desulforamulus aquiferis]RYD04503.1 hypothetical protein N752_14110 [Desulforamulus aquiferis]
MTNKINHLSSALNLLENTLGQELIKKEVHKIDGWNPEGAPNLHPLVLLWYKCREDLALGELTGSLPISGWVQETLELGNLLENLSSNPNYTQILQDLRNISTWEQTIQSLKQK